MLLTMRRKTSPKGTGGVVGFATSTDMVDFTFEGELYAPEDISEPEVPTMFQIGDSWVLMFSTFKDKCTHYRISDSPRGPWGAPTPAIVDGPAFYAGTTCPVDQRRLLFGWIRTARGFGGHLALPREVYVQPDGGIGFRLEETVGQRIRGPIIDAPLGNNTNWLMKGGVVVRKPTDITPDSHLMFEGDYDRFDLQVEARLCVGGERVGVVVESAGSEVTRVVLDAPLRKFLVKTGRDTLAALDIPVPCEKWMTLRVVAEGNILEAFLDDRYCLTAVLPEALQQSRVGLYSSAGGVFRDVHLYQLRTLDEIPLP
ncbi:MAG: hypothetical protein K9M45_14290, partial [Kiritimatiellales bacterium]|nr:hypothetical protein [Kiritimatiellales bacterium]